MDKLKMHSLNKVDENIEKIGKLFPNCITERKDENGKVEHAIDFDMLKQELSSVVVEGSEERYQFTWPGKRESVLLANAPITRTLRPCREESVDFDNTENLYIEGDNLEVLKLLQETYLGKVKMIYIDPPYNRGKDFIYRDNFAQNADEYLETSGQFDDEGNRLVQNTERNGRFHTDWLNMIYPRLKIAKDLLQDDGLIFISIDENEASNLRKVCDEIFGESNFISQLVWQNKKGGGNDSLYIAVEHEFVLAYARNKDQLGKFYELYSETYAKRYKETDSIGRFYWDTFKRKSGKQYYPIECPDGSFLELDDDGNPISWLRSQSRFFQDLKDGEVRITKINDNWSVQFKQRMPEGKKPRSIFTTEKVLEDKGTTSTGGDDVYKYFKKDVFSNPKPVELIGFLLGFGLQDGEIVLDFFSGSGTLCEAVMALNSADNGNRKYIAVQLEENIDAMLTSSSADAKRIAKNAIDVLTELGKPHFITELAKERIRRAGKKIVEDNKDKEGIENLDVGFRVLKCTSSNMKEVYYTPSEYEQVTLGHLLDNIKEGRTPEDLLFQVMLELGVLLSSKIEERIIAGKRVFNVADGFLMACFDENITEETIMAIAQDKPYYFVTRDHSMATDGVSTNFDQLFAAHSPETVRKVL